MKHILSLLCFAGLLPSCLAQLTDADAEDCIVYEGKSSSEPPVKELQQQVLTAVTPQSQMFSATLNLSSANSSHICTIHFISPLVLTSCTDGDTTKNSPKHKWPVEVFRQDDTTELWLQITDSEDAIPSSDLVLVGRRGKHRGHLVFPNSGLTPPVRMQWKPIQEMEYYFNCITGCVLSKAAETQVGEHTVFLRQGEGDLHLTLSYESGARGQYVTNLTLADLGPPGGLKTITLVWNDRVGDTGVLLDGVPLGGLTKYSSLNVNSGVKVEVMEGEALVAACNHHFHDVTVLPPARRSPRSTETGIPVWILVLLAVVLLTGLATTALFAVLHYSATMKLQQLQGTTFSSIPRTSSLRSSKRHKDLPGGTPKEAEEDCKSASEVTMAHSETTVTPLTTPASLNNGPRSNKLVETRDFVDLELM
ncbi:uncharacterized protein [Cherax quadricarinatus]